MKISKTIDYRRIEPTVVVAAPVKLSQKISYRKVKPDDSTSQRDCILEQS